jgi:membrane associated rhomboid family serine protease
MNDLSEITAWVRQWTTPVIRWMSYTCVVGFLLFLFVPDFMVMVFGASFTSTLLYGQYWQLFTYAFVHGGFNSLFINVYSLALFGTQLERRWGGRTFLRFALVVIVGAVLTHLVMTPIMHQQNARIIGISGLVYGVLLAYTMYYPNEAVYPRFKWPVQPKYYMPVWGLTVFASSIGEAGGGIAHITHLGGLFFGYLFVRHPRWFQWISLPDPDRRK